MQRDFGQSYHFHDRAWRWPENWQRIRPRDGDYSAPLEMSRRPPATAEVERMLPEFDQSFWTSRG